MKRKEQIRIDGHQLTLTNPEKIYFPDAGFTKGQVIRFYSDIAHVLLPHLQDRPLTLKRYVAKVRNGFVDRTRKELFAAIKTLQTAKCPFANLPENKASRWGEALTAEKMKECRWVKPLRVCQVAFLEWTEGGKLRHCTFLAMRVDKKPKSVVREI